MVIISGTAWWSMEFLTPAAQEPAWNQVATVALSGVRVMAVDREAWPAGLGLALGPLPLLLVGVPLLWVGVVTGRHVLVVAEVEQCCIVSL